MKQKEVLIGRGLSQQRFTLSGRLSFNNRSPCRPRGRGCTLSEDPSWAASAWLTPVETALQAQIPAEHSDTKSSVKMQIWRWSSKTWGSPLPLRSLSSVSHLGTGLKKKSVWLWGRDQHARWRTCICTAHFEKAFPFNEFRSHERILVQDFWTLRDNFFKQSLSAVLLLLKKEYILTVKIQLLDKRVVSESYYYDVFTLLMTLSMSFWISFCRPVALLIHFCSSSPDSDTPPDTGKHGNCERLFPYIHLGSFYVWF